MASGPSGGGDLEEGLAVTLQVARVLEGLGVAYLVGGSMASIVHGVVRTTQDVDLVADLRLQHVASLVRALEADFYVEEGSIRDAVNRASCFNVIHLATMFKVDVYLRRARAFDDAQFERRVRVPLTADGADAVEVASAEDTILAKLEWFRLGNEVSERQWGDVLGVIRTQQGRLDLGYLRRWAAALQIAELLERALAAAAG